MLNEQQKKVVDFFKGQCVVTATAGSGKTMTVTERVASLIEKGINPSRILCLTFTNKAGMEMNTRICEKLGVDTPNFYIGTFHSLCVKILKRYCDRIGYEKGFSIFDDDDQSALMKHIFKEMGYTKAEEKKFNIRSILYKVNMSREMAETEEQMADRFEDEVDLKLAQKYLLGLKEQNAFDFSGLLFETIKLLEDNTDVREKLQDMFEFIQVDEMQDTNYAQFKLINLFAGKHKNIVLTGDTSQSIYRFRGARIENVSDFMSMYPDCIEIHLGQNYRSTPQIIRVSEKLIKHNKSFMGGDFTTENADGEEPTCDKHYSSREEAESVASKIKYYIEEEGWEPSEIVVLYRLNRLSLEIQSSLGRNGIPFAVIGGPGFFDRREIKDCVAMLKWLSNPKDKMAFHRVIDMFGGIGETTYNGLVNIASKEGLSLMQACEKIDTFSNRKSIIEAAKSIKETFTLDTTGMHAGQALSSLISRVKYEDKLRSISKNDGEFQDRQGNVSELINNATLFGQKNSSIDAYLQNMALISSADKNSGDVVTLQTIHSVKGLEYSIVFIIGAEKGILPHSMAINEGEANDDVQGAIEEERRIFFVSLSRAKKHLHVSYCASRMMNSFGKLSYMNTGPSSFLYEAGLVKKWEI